MLGDATKVEFVAVATDARFPALQAGEIDVLVRNTTWTASRDGNDGATFLHPTFYDGQQMMVAADSGYTSIDDMDGAVVCVAAGTTTEGNVATEFASPRPDRRRAVVRRHRPRPGGVPGRPAATGGRATAASWPRAGPTTRTAPDSLVIFDEVFSKEPLTPAVDRRRHAWAQAVEWAIFATIQAEELGITTETAAGRRRPATTRPRCCSSAARTPTATTLDPGLGLPTDFALQVVTQVGNYGEIFEANLAPIGITERGLNALWSDGGLQYAPPYR